MFQLLHFQMIPIFSCEASSTFRNLTGWLTGWLTHCQTVSSFTYLLLNQNTDGQCKFLVDSLGHIWSLLDNVDMPLGVVNLGATINTCTYYVSFSTWLPINYEFVIIPC